MGPVTPRVIRGVCQPVFALDRSKQRGGPRASVSVLRAARVQRAMHNERASRGGVNQNKHGCARQTVLALSENPSPVAHSDAICPCF